MAKILIYGKETIMRLLQNFTIRIVMLAILGLFCLLWSGVGYLVSIRYLKYQKAMRLIVISYSR